MQTGCNFMVINSFRRNSLGIGNTYPLFKILWNIIEVERRIIKEL